MLRDGFHRALILVPRDIFHFQWFVILLGEVFHAFVAVGALGIWVSQWIIVLVFTFGLGFLSFRA